MSWAASELACASPTTRILIELCQPSNTAKIVLWRQILGRSWLCQVDFFSVLAFPRNSHCIIVLILPEEGVEKCLLGSCPCFSCLVASCLVGFSCLVGCCPWQRPWNPATASHHFCHCGFIEHQSQDQDQARWRRWQPVGKCRQSNCNSRCRQICKICNWFWSACNGEPNLQLVLISL